MHDLSNLPNCDSITIGFIQKDEVSGDLINKERSGPDEKGNR